jgi:outer membrane receptor protein involved in Fe transport
MKYVSIICTFLFLPHFLFSGTVGKIKGKVSDRETGTPLAGATVIIVGTTYDAVSDTNGEYVILAVPVGIHSLKANSMGYREVTIKDIWINIDLTRTVNLELSGESLEESGAEIKAEQPLINTNTTNSVSIITSEEIQYKPLRGYRPLVALAPGSVTDDDGNSYVRGGRIEETAYYIDGVYQNNLRLGTPIGSLSAYSLEEVSVQAGGFSAEYGFASSAIVNATTKTGGSHLTVFGEFITDEWLSQSNEQLGAFSYGYNVANLAISGPLPVLNDRVRFFASIERNYLDDATPSVGVHPVLIVDKPPFEGGVPVPEDIDIAEGQRGPIPNNDIGRWIANANITIDLHPLRLKLGGNITQEQWDEALIWNMLANSAHNPRIDRFSQSFYSQMMYALGSNTILNGQVNYFADGNGFFDPILKRDIVNYGDKTDYNNDGVFNPDLPSDGMNIINEKSTAQLFRPAGRISNNFTQNRSSYIGGKFDLTHQLGQIHEFKTGIEFRYHTLKRYEINPMALARIFVTNPDIDPVLAYANSGTDAYGYEFIQDPGPDGDLSEGSLNKYDRAKHPIISAFYVQDKIEASGLVMNLGIRLDYFDANGFTVKDPLNIRITDEGLFDRSQLRDSKTHITVSPRIGVAFPITERTVVYGQYGQFSQQPPYQLLFRGWESISNAFFGGGLAPQNADLAPVKTTAYEVGFRQQLGDYAALDIAAYYKETSDLIRLERLENALPNHYNRFKNGDFGTVKGISINFNVSDNYRLSANLAYTFQFVGGTGSNAYSNDFINILTSGGEDGYPTYVAATDFDQRHTGRLTINVRSNEDDGPIIAGFKPLANFDIGVLLGFGSGFSYTPSTVGNPLLSTAARAIVPRAVLNSAYGPWQAQLDMLINRRFTWGGVDFDVYLWGINILGTQNWDTRTIYGATGDNADPGYLDSADGKNWITEYGGEPAANLYRLRTNTPDRWSTPRQLRLGLRFTLSP